MRIRKSIAGICALLLALLLSGCAGEKKENAIYTDDDPNDPYNRIIDGIFPEYELYCEDRPTLQLLLERGEGLVTYDVLAESALQAHGDMRWYPHFISTVVIAVDRDQTSEEILGWKDLFDSKKSLGMSDSYMEMGYLISAMAYGVEQSGLTYSLAPRMTYDEMGSYLPSKAVVTHLAQRQSDKMLKLGSDTAPVLVLMDYEAVNLKKEGRNLEIIVPKEGTLSFYRGILSKKPMEFPSSFDDLLFETGLRSETGAGELYPDESDYERAVFPEDFEKVEQNIIRTREYLNRIILRTHRYTTATGRDYTLSALAGMALFALWTGSALGRSMKRDISISLLVIGVCMVGWTFVRFVKWQVATDTIANRYLWYSYYIFLLLMPSFFFWISISINKPVGKKIFPSWFKVLLMLEALLLLMVYTNNLHQWVFAFDRSTDFWTKDYRYAWGYWIVLGCFGSQIIASVIILCIKCWRSTIRVRILLPVAVILCLTIYMYAYIKHISVVFYGDMVMTSCLFVLAFGETAIRTNLIPLNTKYVSLFDNSSMDMQILSDDGRVQFRSISAEAISRPMVDYILENTKPLAIRFGEEKLLRADAIIGGVVVWEENIREVLELRKKISQSLYLIEHTNSMLSHRSKISAEREAVRARTLLNQQLHQEVGDKLERLDALAKELKRLEENKKIKEYELTLAEISLTTVYIKRRCNFIFYVDQNKMSANALVTYISELFEYAQPLGIKSASALGIAGVLDMQESILLYDFCFSVISFLSREEPSDLMVNFRETERCYRLLFISETNFETYLPSEEMLGRLAGCRAMISNKNLDEAYSLQIEIPIRREERRC